MLTVGQANDAITMEQCTDVADPTTCTPGLTLNGEQQTSTGAINGLTVVDARGSLIGWAATATMGDLLTGPNNSVANGTIPKANMQITPSCLLSTATSGIQSEVVAGDPAQNFGQPGLGVTLCTAAAGGGGGTFEIEGPLTLTVPASIYNGRLHGDDDLPHHLTSVVLTDTRGATVAGRPPRPFS